MANWAHTKGKRLTAAETKRVQLERGCLTCEGALLRMAQRELFSPWRWIPCGYICDRCNTIIWESPQ